MSKRNDSQLHQFFGAYFHEDWMLESPDPDSIITAYTTDFPNRSKLEQLAALIDEFVAAEPDDEQLDRALFVELGCYYDPRTSGLSAGDWLQHVAGMFRAASRAL